MNDAKKQTKSITIRLDESDLADWAAAQNSPVTSIRMAMKICILQFGKNADLPDAILQSKFGNGNFTTLSQKSDVCNTSVSNKSSSMAYNESEQNSKKVRQTQAAVDASQPEQNPVQMDKNYQQTQMMQQPRQAMPTMETSQPTQPMQQQPDMQAHTNINQNQSGAGMSDSLASLL